MNLEVLYESASPCVVALISKLLPLPAGQQPIFPDIFGTGFLVNDSGLVVTNRHVVEVFDQLGRNAKTGEFAGAALMFLVEGGVGAPCFWGNAVMEHKAQTHTGRFALLSRLGCADYGDAHVYF